MKIAQSRHKDRKDDKKTSPTDLRGCLHVLHAAVASHKRISRPAAEGWLRVTLHRLDGEMLEQTVDYVGSEEPTESGRVAGRRSSVRAGLIGRVARTNDVRDLARPAAM